MGIYLIVALPIVARAQGQAQQQTFNLQHADVATVAGQVRTTLGDSGIVFPDAEGKRLVVQASPDQLARVSQLVATLDQQTNPPAATGTAGHYLNAYSIPASRQAAAKGWAATFQSTNGARVAYDDRSQQLLVMGPGDLHSFVSQNVVAAPTSAAPAGGGPAANLGQNGQRTPEPSRLVLRNISPDALHARVQQLLDRQIPMATDSSGQWISFRAELSPNTGVMIEVNRSTGEVRLSGAPQQVSGWNKVLTSIDVPPTADESVAQLVATTPNTDPHIRRALQAVQAQGQLAGTIPGQLASMQIQPVPGTIQPAPQPAVAQPGAAQPGVAQPGAQVQPNQPVPPGQPAPAEQQQSELGIVGSALNDGSLMGPVQIQFIEGTDLIVVRGSKRDVERVMQIINRIEQASAETVPRVEIHPLQHVDSRSMAALLERIYSQVLTARTGSVSITPLGKPNSLLLVGRPENVQTAIELIQKIDLPVEPTSRFEVFPLQNASAVDAKALIDEFLAEEDQQGDNVVAPALAPRALVVADTRTNSLVVSASPRELVEIGTLLRRIDARTAAAVDEVRIFPVRNTLATDLAEVLRSAIFGEPAGDERGAQTSQRVAALQLMTIDPANRQRLESGILSNIRITANAPANTLVVTAPTDTMDLIAALIAQLDRAPDAVAEIKVFTIKNGDAQTLADMLRTLFGGTEGGAPSFGASENSIIPLTFSVDPRTNSIIAAGTAQDLAVAYAILLKLDASEVRQRQNKVYRLKNSPALEVATALNELLRTERDVEISADLALSAFEQMEREVIIVPEIVSNSLIVSSTPRYYEEIERLIDELDERPAMVTIQVLIAEVRLNDTDEFGVELGLQDSILFDRSVIQDFDTISTTTTSQTAGGATVTTQQDTLINQTLAPGFNFNNQPLGNNAGDKSRPGNVGTQGLSNFALNRVNPELGFGGFVFAASSNSVSALLRALQETRRLEVLSRPQVTALDNQQAIIQVGQRVPRIASTQVNQFGQQQNSVVYEPVGINLMVRPRISPDGMVVMELQAEKSQVGSEQEGIPLFAGPDGTVVRAPRIDQTIAYSTVAAASGQTIVLSGLLTKETFDIHRRVPLLADIPLLGDFFRYDSVSEERTELLIILTPRVIRSELDAEMIKQVESSRMSYVLCDVVNMHGPSGLKSRCDDWTAAEAPSVYPTEVPTEDFSPLPTTVPMGPTLEPTPASPQAANGGTGIANPAAIEPASFVAPGEATSLQRSATP
jgi:general secretion pathway protein D